MFSFNLTIVVFAFFQISATMQKFEGMFEDLDVNTQVECAVNSIMFYLLLWKTLICKDFTCGVENLAIVFSWMARFL